MRKLIFIALFLISSCVIFAQDVTVLLAEGVCSTSYNDTTNEWNKWSKWEGVNLTIVLDYATNIVRIDNKYEDKFKITKWNGSEELKDVNNEPYSHFKFSAIDKDGKLPDLSIKYYSKSGNYHVMIIYSNYAYMYQGKEVKF